MKHAFCFFCKRHSSMLLYNGEFLLYTYEWESMLVEIAVKRYTKHQHAAHEIFQQPSAKNAKKAWLAS